ncbi:response regulator transcription factor [Pantoea sp. PNT02]|jgi:two-component system response regulator EvgA|uniref:Response regulator transcription factor n=1 Tax=Pantoea leporis TaxID=2933780 RepID=A0ABV2DY84_9GAMM|nr:MULTISPECIES: response regulator transcription factor [Pantoea]MBD9644549.1 response regulator transcription factor [Pantoea sp. PNT02]MBD9659656.1 response regulator transcription factor [Pantoea sp. PNT03]MDR6353052.1 two-component system response regulator EvgA [Pantoea sp. SORGH_AS_0659]PYG49744.1 LuxR family two component transcriptional regulator [Pantoea sp. AG1095]QCP62187.1 response regulator transcription factor [Pantoea sp. SO10]
MKKVIIVDDHPVIRFAVKMLLERNEMEVVAETNNGVDAIQKTRECLPDLVLLDIGLPKIDGFQVLERLRTLNLSLKILVLTSQSSSHFAQRCKQAGADGFVTKSDDMSELLDAIKMVMRGYSFFPQSTYQSYEQTDSYHDDDGLLEQLSDRELSVLVSIGKGMGNKQIGEQLLLSEKTISTYKHRLKQKLNAQSLIDLIDFARRNNLIK